MKAKTLFTILNIAQGVLAPLMLIVGWCAKLKIISIIGGIWCAWRAIDSALEKHFRVWDDEDARTLYDWIEEN